VDPPPLFAEHLCLTYRYRVFDDHRFDPTVEGPSPRLESLDFSFRLSRQNSKARCIHHFSPINRRSLPDTVREQVVRRYWVHFDNIHEFIQFIELYSSADYFCISAV